VTKKQQREWAREKARRQAERRDPRTYESETPLGMLRNFLPEANSNTLARLRREPERLSFWQRLWFRVFG
jgi:hypothetical protein